MDLEDIRAAEHELIAYASDHAMTAFLMEIDARHVHLDNTAHMTEVEIRHLSQARGWQ